ncbi:hypothetical protein HPB47_027420, partial [Ixodes persulcatus]
MGKCMRRSWRLVKQQATLNNLRERSINAIQTGRTITLISRCPHESATVSPSLPPLPPAPPSLVHGGDIGFASALSCSGSRLNGSNSSSKNASKRDDIWRGLQASVRQADAFPLERRVLVRAKAQLLAASKQPTLQVGVHRDDYVLSVRPRHHGDHERDDADLSSHFSVRETASKWAVLLRDRGRIFGIRYTRERGTGLGRVRLACIVDIAVLYQLVVFFELRPPLPFPDAGHVRQLFTQHLGTVLFMTVHANFADERTGGGERAGMGRRSGGRPAWALAVPLALVVLGCHPCRAVTRQFGLPDCTVAAGHLFNYTIPKDSFTGGKHRFE